MSPLLESVQRMHLDYDLLEGILLVPAADVIPAQNILNKHVAFKSISILNSKENKILSVD